MYNDVKKNNCKNDLSRCDTPLNPILKMVLRGTTILFVVYSSIYSGVTKIA